MSTEKKIFKILSCLSEREDIKNNDSLQDDLGLDSLQMVILLVEIENVFKIELEEKDMNPYDLIDVSDIIALIKKYKGEKNV